MIRDAFVEIEDISAQLERPDKFIVIGPKGAGKTAVASRAFLLADSNALRFVEVDQLETFEFGLLKKIGGAGTQQFGGAHSAWKLLLLLRLFELLVEDESLSARNHDFHKFVSQLVRPSWA